MFTPPPLALAGPAEAAALASYGIHGGALVISVFLLLVSWKRRGWVSASLALLLLGGDGMLLEVFDVFTHPSPANDPDALHWDRVWRVLCLAWFAISAFGVVCLCRALMPPPGPKETHPVRPDSPPCS